MLALAFPPGSSAAYAPVLLASLRSSVADGPLRRELFSLSGAESHE
jgi:hypothetical protein